MRGLLMQVSVFSGHIVNSQIRCKTSFEISMSLDSPSGARRVISTSMGNNLRLNLLNTAWCSQLHERQGELIFPVNLWESAGSPPNSPELVISVLHHPYNWITSNNARELRAALDRRSDLILTGHEHDHTAYSKRSVFGAE